MQMSVGFMIFYYRGDEPKRSEGCSVAAEMLVEGLDYHVEGGRWVFTAHYLLTRGNCCASGCRHCPYGFVKPARDESTDAGKRDALGRADDGDQSSMR